MLNIHWSHPAKAFTVTLTPLLSALLSAAQISDVKLGNIARF
jgi:hypothetical protein